MKSNSGYIVYLVGNSSKKEKKLREKIGKRKQQWRMSWDHMSGAASGLGA